MKHNKLWSTMLLLVGMLVSLGAKADIKSVITLDAAEYEPGAKITVSLTNSEQLGAKDWVGVYKESEYPGNEFKSVTWDYVSGATLELDAPSVGKYYVTLLENDGYDEIAERVAFEVVAPASKWEEPALVDGVYQIGNASQLEWFAEYVASASAEKSSGENDVILTSKAVLTADIDMTGVKHTPIGVSQTYKYNGQFDGQHHRILNMTLIDETGEGVYKEGAALFGVVRGGTIIKNIIIDKSCVITAKGRAGGIIANVQTNVANQPLLILNCVNEANITSTGSVASGIIGAGSSQYPYFEMHNCVNLGNIQGASNNKGVAFNGWSKDTGTNCRIWHCYTIGEISPLDGTSQMFRGNFRDCNSSFDLTNTDAGFQGDHITWTTADPVASGELCWYLNNQNLSICPVHKQAVSYKQEIGVDPYPMPVAEGKVVYQIADLDCAGNPKGSVSYSNVEGGTRDEHVDADDNGFCDACGAILEDWRTEQEDGYYHFSTVKEIQWWSAMVRYKFHGCMNVKLDADIDFEGVPNAHYPIGVSAHKWAAKFDGQGHRIKGMVITRDLQQDNEFDGLGFFGSVRGGVEDAAWGQRTENVEIKNLIIDKSCSIDHKGKFAAGVLGHVNSTMGPGSTITIENCVNEANISIDGANAAGILGCVEATQVGIVIRNCYNTGNIKGGIESATICAWTGTANDALTKEFSSCWNIGELQGLDGNGYNMFRVPNSNAIRNIFDLADNGGNQGKVEFTTADPLTSGELCYLLNEGFDVPRWYQTLGEDATPTTDASHEVVVKTEEGEFVNISLPTEMLVRSSGNWGGEKMTEAADSNPANRHFTYSKYYKNDVQQEGIFINFKSGDEWFCPASGENTIVNAGEEVTEIVSLSEEKKGWVVQNQTGYMTVDVYYSAEGSMKITFTDNTVEALKDVEALYVVGEQTTNWSRSSSECQKLEKKADGIYEGVVNIKRDNMLFDAARIITRPDNGDDDNHIGALNVGQQAIVGTRTLGTGSTGRMYLRKGENKITVNFNEGTINVESINPEPSYMYAVGTLVDHTWQNTNTAYKLEEAETNVFQGIVKVAEDAEPRFSLFCERTRDDWGDGRFGPADESIRPEEAVATTNTISCGWDRAWRVPAGEWFVTLDLNDGSFTYENPRANELRVKAGALVIKMENVSDQILTTYPAVAEDAEFMEGIYMPLSAEVYDSINAVIQNATYAELVEGYDTFNAQITAAEEKVDALLGQAKAAVENAAIATEVKAAAQALVDEFEEATNKLLMTYPEAAENEEFMAIYSALSDEVYDSIQQAIGFMTNADIAAAKEALLAQIAAASQKIKDMLKTADDMFGEPTVVEFVCTAGQAFGENEGSDKAFDGDVNTKWCKNVGDDSFALISASEPVHVWGYELTTANDNEQYDRRIRGLKLFATNDAAVAADASSAEWIEIASEGPNVEMQAKKNFYVNRYYTNAEAPQTAYQYFKLQLTDGGFIQFSEFNFLYETEEIPVRYKWIEGSAEASAKVTDLDVTTKWEGSLSGNWFIVEAEDGEAHEIKSYAISTHDDGSWGDRAPKHWTIEASNDKESWVKIAEVDNDPIQNVSYTTYEFNVNTTEQYRYIKMNLIEMKGNGWQQMGEFYVKATKPAPAEAGWDGTVTTSLDSVTMKSVSEFEGITLKFNGAKSIVVNSIEEEGETLYGSFEAWNPDYTEYWVWSPNYGSTWEINGDEITLNGWIDANSMLQETKAKNVKRHALKRAAEGDTDYQFEMMDYGETFIIDGEVYEDQIDLFFNAEEPAAPAEPFAITVYNNGVEGDATKAVEASENGVLYFFEAEADVEGMAAGNVAPTLTKMEDGTDFGAAEVAVYDGVAEISFPELATGYFFTAPGTYVLNMPEGVLVDAKGAPSAAATYQWVIIQKDPVDPEEDFVLETPEIATVTDTLWGSNDVYYTAAFKFKKPAGAKYAWAEGLMLEGDNTPFQAGMWGMVELEDGDEVTIVYKDPMLADTDDESYEGDFRTPGTYKASTTIMFMDENYLEIMNDNDSVLTATFEGEITLPVVREEPQADGILIDLATSTLDQWFSGVGNWNGEGESYATYDSKKGEIKVYINQDKDAQWKAQVKLCTTGIELDAEKNYEFTANFTSNNDLGGVTVKIFDNSQLYMTSDLKLEAGANEFNTGAFAGGNVGNGVIVFDFGSAKAGDVITINGIKLFESEGPVIPDPKPETAPDMAEIPADAIVIYADGKEIAPAWGYNESWGQTTTLEELDFDGNHVLYYKNFNWLGWGCASTIDATKCDVLHIDLWAPEAGSICIHPIYGGSGKATDDSKKVVVDLEEGWNCKEIKLADFDQDFSSIFQFKFDEATLKIFAVDNVYFYNSNPTGINSITADGDEVIYNMAGQRINKAQRGVNIINGKKVVIK